MNYIETVATEAMAALIKNRHRDHSGESGVEQLAKDAWMIANEMDKQRKLYTEEL